MAETDTKLETYEIDAGEWKRSIRKMIVGLSSPNGSLLCSESSSMAKGMLTATWKRFCKFRRNVSSSCQT